MFIASDFQMHNQFAISKLNTVNLDKYLYILVQGQW